MSEIREKVTVASRSDSGIRIYRAQIDSDWLHGRVVAIGAQFFAIELVSDAIYLDGYVCLRYTDVSEIEMPDPSWSFIEKALSLRAQRTHDKISLNCTSVETVLRSIPANFGLISITRDKVDSDSCYIGKIRGLTNDSVSLSTINPEAKWDSEPMTIKLADVTRVDFGGAYEEALELVANAD